MSRLVDRGFAAKIAAAGRGRIMKEDAIERRIDREIPRKCRPAQQIALFFVVDIREVYVERRADIPAQGSLCFALNLARRLQRVPFRFVYIENAAARECYIAGLERFAEGVVLRQNAIFRDLARLAIMDDVVMHGNGDQLGEFAVRLVERPYRAGCPGLVARARRGRAAAQNLPGFRLIETAPRRPCEFVVAAAPREGAGKASAKTHGPK